MKDVYKLYEKKAALSFVPASVLKTRNEDRSWEYGYCEEYDLIVISKDGTIGEVYVINSLNIALPSVPDAVEDRGGTWKPVELPPELKRIKSIFDWNRKPKEFHARWVDYIEQEFDRRENGFWIIINKTPTYITGSHYMYVQWANIDVGLPDFREANRVLYIYWEACKADDRCYGMIYLKNRRSGFSFMGSSEIVNQATITKKARFGILSKSGADAKKLFTDKVVGISNGYPFFFKPIQDGMDIPKTELAYRVPASKITKKSMTTIEEEGSVEGLETSIDWKNTADNSYDSEKLKMLIHDEAAKWIPPNNILENWRVTKTCLRLGRKIIGKCMMGSTSNALPKGGANYKKLYGDSNPAQRNENGQTKSGLYHLFIPMEWNFEGYIDIYGMPVFHKPKTPIRGMDGMMIRDGAIDYWENEVASLKGDPDALNEFYRQFPRTESHAFRDESKASIFNLTKIYQQVDHNESLIRDRVLTRGYFHWKDGKKDTEVIWTPDNKGRFIVSWIPPLGLRNNTIKRGDLYYPGNEHVGSFGCDSYDISGVVGGGGSNGALAGLTKFHMDEAPVNRFFLEYIARPQTAEIFFEDVLMACFFYGMPMLAENNKPRLLYHFRNRGYRAFSLNRPDKKKSALSKTEKELGGIPNSSEDVKQSHASAIETYIEKYVGLDNEGIYRSQGDMGDMYFNRTLEDWARFDINERTKHDASIASGLAIMANLKHEFIAEKNQSKISVKFAKYNNDGRLSQLRE